MDTAIVKSHLNLRAVIPALGELAARDEEARGIAKRAKGTVQLSLVNGPTTVVDFAGDGGVRVNGEAQMLPSVGMLFPRPSVINKMFAGETAIPILWKGITKLGLIKAFGDLAQRLDAVIGDPDTYLKEHPDQLHTVVSLLFGVATRGVAVLANTDEHIKPIIAGTPRGVANFILGEGEQEIACHFTLTDEGLAVASGKHPKANADLIIPDLAQAFELFQGRLDAMAAACNGTVIMKGHLMLLDGINTTLGRLGSYL